jgi:ComF family protein
LAAEYFCAACRTPFLNRFPLDEHGVCALCRAGERGFNAAYCFGAYEGHLREMIHVFKYGRMKPLGARLGNLLWSALPVDEAFDSVVPVPLHWRRRWSRGFNQAEVLARCIARRRGIGVLRALTRRRATDSQTGLSNRNRRLNVDGAFRVQTAVAGLRILLVDDVMTTGATASACALALKRAGAKHVTLLTLARVDRRLAVPSAMTTLSGVS